MARPSNHKKFHVILTDDERRMLLELLSAGQAPARRLTHARILLKADASPAGPAWGDEAIRQAFDIGLATVARVRQRFVEAGLEAALERQPPRRDYDHLVDGTCEAHLVALACSAPPVGHQHWTLRLLADKLVECQYIDRISHETVRQVLKKTNLSLG